jgi:hypothetical protein
MTTAISPIPTCCRWNSTQEFVDDIAAAAGTAGRQEGPLHGRLRPDRLRCLTMLVSRRRPPTSSRKWRPGRDGKLAANWVINELFGRLEEGRPFHLRKPGLPPSSADHRPDQGRTTISGKIAKDLFEIVWTEGGDPRSDRRGARHETGHRHRRHRGRGRRDHRRQPRTGRKGQGQPTPSSPAGSSAR